MCLGDRKSAVLIGYFVESGVEEEVSGNVIDGVEYAFVGDSFLFKGAYQLFSKSFVAVGVFVFSHHEAKIENLKAGQVYLLVPAVKKTADVFVTKVVWFNWMVQLLVCGTWRVRTADLFHVKETR